MQKLQNSFKYSPFKQSYLEHVRAVQQTQYKTVGTAPGTDPLEAKNFAPHILNDSPEAIGTMGGAAGPSFYAGPPNRPFTKDQVDMIPDSDGGDFMEIMPNGVTQQTNYIILATIGVLVFLLIRSLY